MACIWVWGLKSLPWNLASGNSRQERAGSGRLSRLRPNYNDHFKEIKISQQGLFLLISFSNFDQSRRKHE